MEDEINKCRSSAAYFYEKLIEARDEMISPPRKSRLNELFDREVAKHLIHRETVLYRHFERQSVNESLEKWLGVFEPDDKAFKETFYDEFPYTQPKPNKLSSAMNDQFRDDEGKSTLERSLMPSIKTPVDRPPVIMKGGFELNLSLPIPREGKL